MAMALVADHEVVVGGDVRTLPHTGMRNQRTGGENSWRYAQAHGGVPDQGQIGGMDTQIWIHRIGIVRI